MQWMECRNCSSTLPPDPSLQGKHERSHLTKPVMITLKVLPVGEFQANCYLLVVPREDKAILIDPGDQADDILDWIGPLQVTQILITHGHRDHVGALAQVCAALSAPVGIHPSDAELYGIQAEFNLVAGFEFELGGARFRVYHIPGHTPGSVGLRLISAGEPFAVVGDAIFPGGPGRTETAADLATSLKALAKTVFTWQDETLLHPGHGGPTTVGAERQSFEAFRARKLPPDLYGDVTWR